MNMLFVLELARLARKILSPHQIGMNGDFQNWSERK